MDRIKFDGLSVSTEVLDSIVYIAAEKVEGVALAGRNQLTSNLLALFNLSAETVSDTEYKIVDGELQIKLGIAVFFGYRFDVLAQNVRSFVAKAVEAQVGVKVASVDVYIDSIVFPKA